MAPKDFLQEYVEEVRENLRELEDSLLALEQRGRDEEEIRRLFRTAHSIKGASSYMGFEDLAELTHEIESVLARILKDSLPIRPEGITTLLGCVDFVSRSVASVLESEQELPVPESLMEALSNFIPQTGPDPGLNPVPDFSETAADSESSVELPEILSIMDTPDECLAAARLIDPACNTNEAADRIEEDDEELLGIYISSFKEQFLSIREILSRTGEGVPAPEDILSLHRLTAKLISASQYMDYEPVVSILKEWEADLDSACGTDPATGTGLFARFESLCMSLSAALPDLGIGEQNVAQVDIPYEGQDTEASDESEQPVEEEDEELYAIFLDSFEHLLCELFSQFPAPEEELTEENHDRLGLILSKMGNSCRYMSYDSLLALLEDWGESIRQALERGAVSGLLLGSFTEPFIARLIKILPGLKLPRLSTPETVEEESRKFEEEIASLLKEAELADPPAMQPPGADLAQEALVSSPSFSSLKTRRITVVAEDAASSSSPTLRVDAGKVDQLLNQVGELVVTRSEFIQTSFSFRELLREIAAQGRLSKQELRRFRMLSFRLNESTISLGRVTNNLQDSVMRIRMLPISYLFERFPRIVRDQSLKLGKKVELVIDGEDTEIDRRVLERMYDPIVQLLRNAIAHGIESPEERREAGKAPAGTIRLAAYQQGDYVALEIEDDGRGIDTEKLREILQSRPEFNSYDLERLPDQMLSYAIFLPGLSTRSTVDASAGRGIGLDVVKENVERMNGTVDVESFPGQGTRFTVSIPLTVAIIRALLVRTSGQTFTLPLGSVSEIHRYRSEETHSIEGFQVLNLRGRTIPLIHLSRLLNLPEDTAENKRRFVAIVTTSFQEVGLVVDGLIGEREVVIKPIDDSFHSFEGFSGATILGDGTVSLILDVSVLLKALRSAPVPGRHH